jgi:hypothetical protein
MRYIKPNYDKEVIEANDIILASIDLGNGATLTQIDESTAQVGASVNDILGLR